MINDVMLSPAEIADELRPVLLRLSRELRRETERLGVTPRQATLLWLIRGLPGSSLRDLAEQEQISPPALSGYVDRLERAGLVERVRSTTDRRRVGLRITPDGDRLLRRLRARRTTWLAQRLERLEPEETQAVTAALPALRRLLDDPA
jgi:DNA-binding MarR family transcriptional regulator